MYICGITRFDQCLTFVCIVVTVGPMNITMTTDLFEMIDPDTGETVFSTDFSKFRFPDEMESLAVEQALTHRVSSVVKNVVVDRE